MNSNPSFRMIRIHTLVRVYITQKIKKTNVILELEYVISRSINTACQSSSNFIVRYPIDQIQHRYIPPPIPSELRKSGVIIESGIKFHDA